MEIKKRNGNSENYNLDKIFIAIKKCFLSFDKYKKMNEKELSSLIYSLAKKVEDELKKDNLESKNELNVE